MTRNASFLFQKILDVYRLKKFFQKTIDKIKIVCYNLVTRLRKQPN